MSLKLEVGKKYLNRKGEVKKTFSLCPNDKYPFCTIDGDQFSQTGESESGHEFDLVSEYIEPTSEEIKNASLLKDPINVNLPPDFSYAAQKDQKQKRYELAKGILESLIISPRGFKGGDDYDPNERLVACAFNITDEFLKQWNEGEK